MKARSLSCPDGEVVGRPDTRPHLLSTALAGAAHVDGALVVVVDDDVVPGAEPLGHLEGDGSVPHLGVGPEGLPRVEVGLVLDHDLAGVRRQRSRPPGVLAHRGRRRAPLRYVSGLLAETAAARGVSPQ